MKLVKIEDVYVNPDAIAQVFKERTFSPTRGMVTHTIITLQVLIEDYPLMTDIPSLKQARIVTTLPLEEVIDLINGRSKWQQFKTYLAKLIRK